MFKIKNMTELKGKRLLILGGGALTIDIVEKAKSMGVYTIVTDWYDVHKSPAKLVANEYWNEEVFRPDILAKLVKERNIDGVLTNYTDSYLPQYARLCKLAGLPCLATEEQMAVITNKDQSKQLCIDHGISVSKRYEITSIDDIDKMDISFPVLTKPVDNSGQRGIYVCLNKDELKAKYAESLRFSESGNVMIEEYVLSMVTSSLIFPNCHLAISSHRSMWNFARRRCFPRFKALSPTLELRTVSLVLRLS